LILDDAPEVALLRSRMEVCDETPDIFTRCRWFVGYAPEFDAVELGQWPPEYEAIFTRHNGGPGVELTFSRRASEDRRIDIKARNDEFLSRILGSDIISAALSAHQKAADYKFLRWILGF
jgi:hypothetical protein